jgi:hypothetical protein
MKKVFAIFCFSLMLVTAREASAQAELDKGNLLLNAGLGFGRFYGGGVPVAFSAEWAINDAITIGPYFGITTWKYASYYSYTFIDFGGKGAYHFNKHLNLSTDKLDLYGAVMLGYTVSSYNYDGPGNIYYDDDYNSGLSAGLVGGARWYFSDKFSVNGEVGYGLAPLYLGISFKL